MQAFAGASDCFLRLASAPHVSESVLLRGGIGLADMPQSKRLCLYDGCIVIVPTLVLANQFSR
jgi:hypothetical protein